MNLRTRIRKAVKKVIEESDNGGWKGTRVKSDDGKEGVIYLDQNSSIVRKLYIRWDNGEEYKLFLSNNSPIEDMEDTEGVRYEWKNGKWAYLSRCITNKYHKGKCWDYMNPNIINEGESNNITLMEDSTASYIMEKNIDNINNKFNKFRELSLGVRNNKDRSLIKESIRVLKHKFSLDNNDDYIKLFELQEVINNKLNLLSEEVSLKIKDHKHIKNVKLIALDDYKNPTTIYIDFKVVFNNIDWNYLQTVSDSYVKGYIDKIARKFENMGRSLLKYLFSNDEFNKYFDKSGIWDGTFPKTSNSYAVKLRNKNHSDIVAKAELVLYTNNGNNMSITDYIGVVNSVLSKLDVGMEEWFETIK